MPYEAQVAETVNIRGHQNDLIDAYLARPIGSGPYPGVVVIHHMPGWDEATKEIARKFAHHGYVAISPNLHYREGKATAEENSASVRAAGGMRREPLAISVPCRISTAKLVSSAIVPVGGKRIWQRVRCLVLTRPSIATVVGWWRHPRNLPRVNP